MSLSHIYTFFRYYESYPLNENFLLTKARKYFSVGHLICLVISSIIAHRHMSELSYVGQGNRQDQHIRDAWRYFLVLGSPLKEIIIFFVFIYKRNCFQKLKTHFLSLPQNFQELTNKVLNIEQHVLYVIILLLSACIPTLFMLDKRNDSFSRYAFGFIIFSNSLYHLSFCSLLIDICLPVAGMVNLTSHLIKPSDMLRKYVYRLMTYDMILGAYTIPIIVYLFWLYISLLFHFYITLYISFYAIKSNFTLLRIPIWVLLEIFSLLFVINVISLVKRKERKFNETLYWRMAEDKTGLTLNDEFLNFHFEAKQEVDFSACGFFELKNSLLCSLLVTATTHVVIFLQYSLTSANTAPSPDNSTTAVPK